MDSWLWRPLIGASFLLVSFAASAAEVTIYRASDGSADIIRLGYFVDGRQFAAMRGGQKVSIQLPLGLHAFRLRSVDTTWTFNVTANHVIRQVGPGHPPYWTEALIDRDPALLKEFEEAERVEPIDPNPLSSPAK